VDSDGKDHRQGVNQYGLNEVGDVHSLIVSENPAHLAL
jgi:hypothetical protein